ncbi:MAG: glycosyltransferase [Bacteroidales bacterium]
MNNILYLSYDGLTDPLGQSQILPYIIGLSKQQYSFYIISFEKKERFHSNKKYIEDLCKQNNITWFPLSYTKKPPILSTIFDLFRLNKLVKKLLKTEKIDLIHCRSYITSLIGLRFKFKKNIKFIFDMRGFWADERVDGNIWNLNNPIYKIVYNYFKKKEKLFLINSDAIISLTEKAKSEILKLYPTIINSKITVIPCSTDFNKFNPEQLNSTIKIREQLNINDQSFVLTYLGSLGTWYLLDEMMVFFAQLLKKYPDAVFLFISPEPFEKIMNVAEKYNIDKSSIRHCFVRHDQIPQYLSITDLGIMFIKPSYSKMSSSPTKFAEFLAMGIPVICNDIGDLAQHAEQIPQCICISSFSDKIYADVINKLNLNQNYDLEIRNKAKEIYDLTLAVNTYSEVYKKVINENQ